MKINYPCTKTFLSIFLFPCSCLWCCLYFNSNLPRVLVYFLCSIQILLVTLKEYHHSAASCIWSRAWNGYSCFCHLKIRLFKLLAGWFPDNAFYELLLLQNVFAEVIHWPQSQCSNYELLHLWNLNYSMNVQKARIASAYCFPKNLILSVQVQTGFCLLQQYLHLRIASVIFSGTPWAKVSNRKYGRAGL